MLMDEKSRLFRVNSLRWSISLSPGNINILRAEVVECRTIGPEGFDSRLEVNSPSHRKLVACKISVGSELLPLRNYSLIHVYKKTLKQLISLSDSLIGLGCAPVKINRFCNRQGAMGQSNSLAGR